MHAKLCRPALLAAVLGTLAGLALAAEDDEYAEDRLRMIQTIEAHAQSATDALGRDHIDPRVLAVMNEVPRHEFVSAWYEGQAYDDRPLPIGHGQTISQPFIVALMTDLLQVGPDDVVLEVGTGSGYQAAVLAHLVQDVHTIEIMPELAASAERAARAPGLRQRPHLYRRRLLRRARAGAVRRHRGDRRRASGAAASDPAAQARRLAW